jgi:hypothetical protein
VRNGHRDRVLDTRLGSLQLRIPKLRQGSYIPHCQRSALNSNPHENVWQFIRDNWLSNRIFTGALPRLKCC